MSSCCWLIIWYQLLLFCSISIGGREGKLRYTWKLSMMVLLFSMISLVHNSFRSASFSTYRGEHAIILLTEDFMKLQTLLGYQLDLVILILNCCFAFRWYRLFSQYLDANKQFWKGHDTRNWLKWFCKLIGYTLRNVSIWRWLANHSEMPRWLYKGRYLSSCYYMVWSM